YTVAMGHSDHHGSRDRRRRRVRAGKHPRHGAPPDPGNTSGAFRSCPQMTHSPGTSRSGVSYLPPSPESQAWAFYPTPPPTLPPAQPRPSTPTSPSSSPALSPLPTSPPSTTSAASSATSKPTWPNRRCSAPSTPAPTTTASSSASPSPRPGC